MRGLQFKRSSHAKGRPSDYVTKLVTEKEILKAFKFLQFSTTKVCSTIMMQNIFKKSSNIGKVEVSRFETRLTIYRRTILFREI